jgi:hypothetical protein
MPWGLGLPQHIRGSGLSPGYQPHYHDEAIKDIIEIDRLADSNEVAVEFVRHITEPSHAASGSIAMA